MDDWEGTGITEEDHAGPWPAFVDLFAATSLILLLFFVVLSYGYALASGVGPVSDKLLGELQAERQRSNRRFEVRKVGVDVLVTLEEHVAFPRNQWVLDSMKLEGREALRSIGRLVNGRELSPLIREIEIIGHADPSPYPRGSNLTNWTIAATRAASVTEFLVDSIDIDPCLLIPSGRAEHYPRDTALTTRSAASDAADRRIEILLHPALPGDTLRGRRGCRRR